MRALLRSVGFCPFRAGGGAFGFRFSAGFWGSFFELESDFSGGFEFKEGGEAFAFFGDEAAEKVRFPVGAQFVQLLSGDGLLEDDFPSSERAFLRWVTVAEVVGGVLDDASLFASGARGECRQGGEAFCGVGGFVFLEIELLFPARGLVDEDVGGEGASEF